MKETLYEYCQRTGRLELVDEWDAEKNAPFTPTDVTRGSRCSAWWRCAKGHSYQMLIFYRTLRRFDCPYCTGRKCSLVLMTLPRPFRILPRSGILKKMDRSHRIRSYTAPRKQCGGFARLGMNGKPRSTHGQLWAANVRCARNVQTRKAPTI